MSTVNKVALAQMIADKVGLNKKEGEEVVAAFTQIVTDTLVKGDDVTISGFGAFSAKMRAGRVGVNPQNPSQKIDIPPVTVPKFKAGKALKDALKKKGSSTPAEPVNEANTDSEAPVLNDSHSDF